MSLGTVTSIIAAQMTLDGEETRVECVVTQAELVTQAEPAESNVLPTTIVQQATTESAVSTVSAAISVVRSDTSTMAPSIGSGVDKRVDRLIDERELCKALVRRRYSLEVMAESRLT